MPSNRLSSLGLFILALAALLIAALVVVPAPLPVEAAPRPTRTPRPSRTPRPTATPVVTATPVASPTAASPSPTPGGGSPGAWQLVDSPNVNGRSNYLRAVAAVSADDLWAVGEHRTNNGTSVQTLILRWNGAHWSSVPSPNPDPNRSLLSGAAAVSASDVWAVGVSGGATGPNWASLILHWDGGAWSAVPAPDLGSPGTSELRGVVAVAAGEVWAVGAYSSPATGWWNQPLVMRWDGSAWSFVPAPAFGSTAELNAVAAAGPNDVWAVGRALEGNWKTLILHWDGSAWSRVASPNLGSAGNNLSGVTAGVAGEVWAVGSAGNGNSTLTLRWDGGSWQLVPSPNGTARPGINRSALHSVAPVGPGDVWAVGVQAYATVGSAGQPIYLGYTLIEHWDGSAWREVAAAGLPGTGEDGELRGVVALAANDVWAVGAYFEPAFSTQAFRTLVQRYTAP
jgi:hypothetical protein